MRPGRHVASWSRTQQILSSSGSVGDANAFNLLTEGSSSSASPLFTRASRNERLTANASPWQSTSDKCRASNTRRQLSKRVLRSFSRKHWITSGGLTSKSGHVTNISMGRPVTSLTILGLGPLRAAPGLLRAAAAACASAAWRLPSYAKALRGALRLGSTAARSALCQKTRSGREPRRRRGQRLWVLLFFLGLPFFFIYFFTLGLAEELRPRRPPGGGLFVSGTTMVR